MGYLPNHRKRVRACNFKPRVSYNRSYAKRSNETPRSLLHEQWTCILAGHHGGKLATFDGSLAKSLAGTELNQSIEVIT
jgi:hypothetical protein